MRGTVGNARLTSIGSGLLGSPGLLAVPEQLENVAARCRELLRKIIDLGDHGSVVTVIYASQSIGGYCYL